MAKKNKWLLVLLLATVAVNVLLFIVPKKGASIAFEEDIFLVADTASIVSIRLGLNEESILLSRKNKGWVLNQSYSTDPGLVRMLLSIMKHISVKRPVSDPVSTTPVPVSITFEDGQVFPFEVSGNATKTKSYFSNEKKTYEVEIPGYRDYLAGIFELKTDQWRDRVIFDGSWRTIQQLTLDYNDAQNNDFQISFNETFFKVEGVQRMDSSKVVNYLNEFQNWKANERLSIGKMPKYDSLSSTQPFAILTIESINYTQEQVFYIFAPMKNDGFVLVTNAYGEMMVYDRKRISRILLRRDDFKLK